ncbi:MAG TPA: transglycosylase SLT domain-containing protein [Pyrinomonadaceae bacterium]|nr:transglycosylase SLT domain-containing protein [Pyrinomonadaceae bacterium]
MSFRQLPIVILLLCLVTCECARIDALGSGLSFDQPQKPTPKTNHTRARSRETLRKIAQRLNLPVEELVRLNGLKADARLPKGMRIELPASAGSPADSANIVGNRITLADGYSFEVDEVWKEGDETWFRKGNISQRVPQSVSSVRAIVKAPANEAPSEAKEAKVSETAATAVWIHLVGGARFRADEVRETSDGAWYNRGNLSVFLERERIARIEREMPGAARSRNSDWTSGSAYVDQLIRNNGELYAVDPYLIFLVIEHESRFRQYAVSPKGARGLMQLMPGTARRLGVRNSFDPAQNIRGGSQYLKELLTMFGGRVDLALASYNAGEGAVMKYGRAVPPYRETRDYVKRITRRYGEPQTAGEKAGNTSAPSPK